MNYSQSSHSLELIDTEQDIFDSQQDIFDSQQDIFDSQQDIFDSQQDIPQAQSVSVENFELISSDSSPYSTVSSIPTDPPSPVFRKRRRLARVDVTSSQASTIQPEDVTDSQTSDTY
ncbi:hypothetical protein DPMN_158330 [Dreissena polymorpha]|uniref:Uncharacterized protein n=1 Tax=Dreissena polymorpha TaxID=45954 RepID=A0A9D4IPP7_DREPO|nr:hypothetical protein DPMN_158330 [Dreissena polymorpha]